MFYYPIDREVEMRLLELKDAPKLYRLIQENRGHLKTWLGWVDSVNSLQDTKHYIKVVQSKMIEGHGFQSSIRVKDELAGLVGFHNFSSQNRSVAIGYWLGKKYQKKGLAIRSTKALVEYAFMEWDIHRIEIRCAAENFSSQQIPEKLGFQKEGVLREVEWLYDHYVDHQVYSMIKREWEEKNR
ncbi:GNAT family N-acetyltransferase [Isachenkonia alkalipeptolytica]|uniref:GNAT family N-acetyltransferase n=1 Tax=Isachenkonia alkalipeptolytica TaxID=2565777 RepID=A0AA43XIG3_9CLOT|nr:GNAT family protein [Isachenkonia alkalipeptolytica]NBG87377.1 GNAT family N-acetyltransferase [Isachenkonia alkalipeptolytica]